MYLLTFAYSPFKIIVSSTRWHVVVPIHSQNYSVTLCLHFLTLLPRVWSGTTHHGTPICLSETSTSSALLTARGAWDQPAEAADFIYFINYKIRLPDMTRSDLMGYNNSHSSCLAHSWVLIQVKLCVYCDALNCTCNVCDWQIGVEKIRRAPALNDSTTFIQVQLYTNNNNNNTTIYEAP